MKHLGKLVFITMLMLLSCNNAQAGYQPRILLPDAAVYEDEVYIPDTVVPVKRAVIKQNLLQPTPLKQVEANPQLVTKPAQVKPVVTSTQIKKDTALLRILYEGFKPKTKTTVADKIKIKRIIDSVVSKKDEPSTSNGGAGLSYQDLVHIIDSLLKANKIDSTKVIVDTPAIVNKPDTAVVQTPVVKEGPEGFIKNYWWLIGLGVLLAAAVIFFMRKKKPVVAADPKIFFSYAWDQDEALIMQLYSSLKKDGFNVIKDKENMGYKGVISKFMEDIGSADFVIVAISDKYLRSRFCMYELYEIFRNSGMNRDKFSKKIFPIRIDESINLSDPDVVNTYASYWKQEEQEWTTRIKEQSDSVTEEQARQFQFIKRLVNDINNILSCLANINSLNLNTLRGNDFADVKSALRNSMQA